MPSLFIFFTWVRPYECCFWIHLSGWWFGAGGGAHVQQQNVLVFKGLSSGMFSSLLILRVRKVYQISSPLSARENRLVLHHLFLDFFSSIFSVIPCGIRILRYTICSLLLFSLILFFLSD